MRFIGIVGHGSDKFDNRTEELARRFIFTILQNSISIYESVTMVSGHSPVGGIDIWAEEIAIGLDIPMDLKIPRQNCWNASYGYKQRNLDIARTSDEVHVILVKNYPNTFKGQKFPLCYHCDSKDHIKSGGCWTGKKAKEMGKICIQHTIE